MQVLKVKQAGVHQVRGYGIFEGVKHIVQAPWMLLFPFAQHHPDLLALQVILAAAQGTGDDGELPILGPADQVALGHIGHGPDDHMLAIVDALRMGDAREREFARAAMQRAFKALGA
mgnify:CR=1 FL=1